MTVLVPIPISSVTASALSPLVGQHCPNAPSASIEFWVRQAAIEFCRSTLAHQSTLAAFDTVIGQSEYTLNCGTDLQASKLLSVRVGGRRMTLIAPAELDERADLDTVNGSPDDAYLSGTNKLTLYPAPSAVEAVVVRLALEPTQDAATIDGDLYAQYAKAIACGAIKWLAMIPDGRDERLASAMASMFDQEVGKAKAATLFNRSRSSRRSTPTWC